MSVTEYRAILSLIESADDRPKAELIHQRLLRLLDASELDLECLIALYDDAISLAEKELWQHHGGDEQLQTYQQIFCEQEYWIAQKDEDDR